MKNKMVRKITNVEIPVTDLKQSLKWYTEMLGLEVQHQDNDSAMLSFELHGAATIFLVKTEKPSKLVFHNTSWGIAENSVIDFYTEDLQDCHQWMKEQGVKVSELNGHEDGLSGFGVTDPDGHVFGICNADHDR
ncbi:VOC family protein [Halobacillus naozhouensis]|uniref:VOC family protein n=1 Tax=Halobacillus naozhouensis TaxID=554880 RepID=A0ABY8J1H7_9BACI|nr:VOC family protein [Halobacillus naozhouensis]WFT76353.1 VOC family protein [Halobacillus naozhouensis]